MPDEAPRVLAGRRFWIGHLDGHEVVAVLSGVGKVAAADDGDAARRELGVERAIFTGTAGGLHAAHAVGDVVVAEALLQHDMDASPLFPRHEVPFYGTDRFATDAPMSAALAAAARSVLAAALARGAGDGGEGLDAARSRASASLRPPCTPGSC
jgi:adenosylhomocysteine nucleosidase